MANVGSSGYKWVGGGMFRNRKNRSHARDSRTRAESRPGCSIVGVARQHICEMAANGTIPSSRTGTAQTAGAMLWTSLFPPRVFRCVFYIRQINTKDATYSIPFCFGDLPSLRSQADMPFFFDGDKPILLQALQSKRYRRSGHREPMGKGGRYHGLPLSFRFRDGFQIVFF